MRRICFLIILLAGLTFTVTGAEKKKFTLVVDAGHGGKDPGTRTKTSMEKTIALKVALAFGRYVEQNCPDVRVIYTRKTDVFIPLGERAAIANRNKADVFISIHVNSVASKKPVSGLETYTMGMRRSDEKLSAAMRENEVVLIEDGYQQRYAGFDPRSPESYIIFEVMNEKNMAESVELAQLIQKNVCATAGRPNKGVKQDAFLVLRETSMPACLIELGYITTPSEEAYMTNSKNVDLMARGIYQAFVAYKSKHGGGPSPALKPEKKPAAKEQDEPADSSQQKQEVAPQKAKEEAAPQKQETAPQKQEPVASAPTPLLSAPQADDGAPVFKVQILTSDRKLKTSDARLKGLKDVDSYHEGKLWKYTVGASTDYNEIYRLRKEVVARFPQAFIIAFKNGEKTDVQAAIQEFKKSKRVKK
ncbi:MAG: N-acetylmuramoyl-L-alanine amidase [Prevotella sp.]|nr:N-acetylmuramoyl-L-alanine amidase [Prevotella sp.]